VVTVKLTAPVPVRTRHQAERGTGSPFSEVIEIGAGSPSGATTEGRVVGESYRHHTVALAVPTTIKPDDVTSYTGSPATMPASVIVKVIGAVAVGDEPSSLPR